MTSPTAPLSDATRTALDKLLKTAARAPKKVATAAKKLAKQLGVTAEAVAVLDAAAIAVRNAAKPAETHYAEWERPLATSAYYLKATPSPANQAAAELFAAARALAQKVGETAAPAELLEQYRAFAARGALSTAGLEAWLRTLAKTKKHGVPVDALAELAIRVVEAGDPPSSKLVAALAKLAPELPARALTGWAERGPDALLSAEADLFEAAAPYARAALSSSEAAGRWAMCYAPHGAKRVMSWLRFLDAAGLGALAATAGAEAAKTFCEVLLGVSAQMGSIDDERVALLASLLSPALEPIRAARLSLRVTPDPEPEPGDLPGRRSLWPAEILELLLMLEAPLAIPDASPESYSIGVVRQVGPPYTELERVGRHPFFGAALRELFLLGLRDQGPTDANAEWLGELAAHAAPRAGYAAAFEALAAWARDLADHGTLGAYETVAVFLDVAAQPAVLEAQPDLARSLSGLDAARLLQNQLNAGLMDEWGWPALDEANDRLGKDVRRYDCGGEPPYRVLWDRDGHRVAVAGPDGVVLDAPFEGPENVAFRYHLYRGDDAILVTWNHPHHGYRVLAGDVLEERCDPAPGETWYDLEGEYHIEQRGRVGPDGRGGVGPGRPNDDRFSVFRVEPDDRSQSVPTDPRKRRQRPELPRWLREQMREGDWCLTEGTHLGVVPVRAADSPLGARDHLGGFALVQRPDGEQVVTGVDGRTWSVPPGFPLVCGLMTFPERDGFYPIVTFASNLGVYLPGGSTVLMPLRDDLSPRYCGGGPQWLPLDFWYWLQPRDRAGSRALRDCSHEAARRLYDAAVAARAAGAGGTGGDAPQELDYPGLKVEMRAAPEQVAALAQWPGVASVVAEVLPEVTHPRLRAGVVGLAMTAAELGGSLDRLKERLPAEGATPGARSELTNKDGRALGDLLDYDVTLWWNRPAAPLGQQILDASVFLFDARSPVPEADRPLTRTPVVTAFPWHRAFRELGHVLWRLLALGTPDERRAELVAVLELLAATPLGDPLERLRYVELEFDTPPLAGVDADHRDRLAEWQNRYFLRLASWDQTGQAMGFEALEVSPDGVFREPPGARVSSEHRPGADGVGGPAIPRALELLASSGPVPYMPAAAERIAAATGLLLPTAALLWVAAADPWETSKDVRKDLGFKATELELGVTELGRFATGPVLAAAMPSDPSALYRPLEPDASGVAPVERLAEAWNAAYGRRPGVAVDDVLKAKADLRDSTRNYDLDVRLLQDPDHHPSFTVDERWVIRPYEPFGQQHFDDINAPAGWPKLASMGEEPVYPGSAHAFSGFVLRNQLAYLAWAYLERPFGDPLRKGAARVAALLRERLANPDLLLLGGLVDLSALSDGECAAAFRDVVDRFTGPLYRAVDGGASAPGRDCGDVVVTWPSEAENGVFFAVRPAAVAGVEALAKLRARFEVDDGFRIARVGAFEVRGAADTDLYLLWRTPGFQALVAELDGGSLPEGAFAADPRHSAPSRVAEARLRHGLDEDPAVLLLQVAALPLPVRERVCRYNDWTAERFDAAAKVLVERGLVVDGRYAGTSRQLFAPGEVIVPKAPAEAIERGKIALYTPGEVDAGEVGEVPADGEWVAPFGVVLPVRPLGAMFAANRQQATGNR